MNSWNIYCIESNSGRMQKDIIWLHWLFYFEVLQFTKSNINSSNIIDNQIKDPYFFYVFSSDACFTRSFL